MIDVNTPGIDQLATTYPLTAYDVLMLPCEGAAIPKTAGQLQNFIALFFVRSSICIFLLRLLSRTHKNLRHVIFGAIGLNLAATILITFTFSFQCVPFAGSWDKTLAAECYPKRTFQGPPERKRGERAIDNSVLASMG